MAVMDQRARRAGGDAFADGVVDDDMPDRGREQRRQRAGQRLPDVQPAPAAVLQEPIVRGPGARETARQDGIGDVAAFAGGRAHQQFKEGGARPRRYRRTKASDQAGQDGGNCGAGHRLNRSR
jgi:hypothetical protein